MLCVAVHALMSCAYCMMCTHRQAGCPYENMVCQKLHIDLPFAPAKGYLSKLTASHFSSLNMRIANQNVLKKLLIAMHNNKKADCNENHRIFAEESIGPLYKE